MGLARVNNDGSEDLSFNARLIGLTNVSALALQPDGKIIASGGLYFNVSSQNAEIIARFNTDGSRDTSFTDPFPKIAPSSVGACGLALQPDGKVVIGGEIIQVTGNNLARLNADGTLDTSFDIGTGINAITPGRSRFLVYAVAVHTNGKIVVGGHYDNFNGGPAEGILQLNPNGSRDASFDSNGPGFGAQVFALLQQPDGKLLVGFVPISSGGLPNKLNASRFSGIGRLNADGTTDATFVPPPFNANGGVVGIALQADGKVIIAGSGLSLHSQDYKLVRLNADGSLDTSFAPPSFVGGINIAIQPDGKVIAEGTNGQLFRLNTDGSLDHSFAGPRTGAGTGIFTRPSCNLTGRY